MTENWRKKISDEKIYFFLIKNCNLLISRASTKNAESTGEAFSPQKRTSSTSNHEIS
jgi:hypothetical protein